MDNYTHGTDYDRFVEGSTKFKLWENNGEQIFATLNYEGVMSTISKGSYMYIYDSAISRNVIALTLQSNYLPLKSTYWSVLPKQYSAKYKQFLIDTNQLIYQLNIDSIDSFEGPQIETRLPIAPANSTFEFSLCSTFSPLSSVLFQWPLEIYLRESDYPYMNLTSIQQLFLETNQENCQTVTLVSPALRSLKSSQMMDLPRYATLVIDLAPTSSYSDLSQYNL
jgi:hypothetical protein